MEPQKFNGLKLDLDRMSPEELTNLRSYVGARLVGAMDELAVLDEYISPNNLVPLFPPKVPEAPA